MRQIRPHTSYADAQPAPLPTATTDRSPVDATEITVDLRDHQVRHPSYTDEARVRRQLATVRAAVAALMDQLSDLVDQRENLKAELDLLTTSHPSGSERAPEDHSVVAWGFYDDDL